MKKGLAFLPLITVLLTSCPASNESSNLPLVTISEEDKIRPTSSNLEYEDYGVNSDNNFAYNEEKFYRNDLEIRLPDPAVFYEDGLYYVYGTTDRTGAKSFDCYTTTDFNHYEVHYDIFKPSEDSWGNDSLFAPELYKFGDTYYLYYSAKNLNSNGIYSNSAIMVATADNPLGPFKEYQGYDGNGEYLDGKANGMFWDIDRGNISILDQTLLVDGDDIYLYYSIYDTNVMQYIVGVKMVDPITPDWDTYQILLRPGALSPDNQFDKTLSWECFQGFRVAEGPQVTKTPTGEYLLSYSVNHYPDMYYTVCYALSDEPLGTYVKPYTRGGYWTNILFGYGGTKSGTTYNQWQGFMAGTGHHFIFKIGEQYMIAYHALVNRKDIASGRGVGIDYLFFDQDGKPYVHGPSYSVMPLPSAISGYSNIALNASIASEGVTYPERLNDNFIVEHYNLVAEQDKEASLSGTSYIKLQFDREYHVGGILIYNSAYFDYFIEEISFIKFNDQQAILDGKFLNSHINNRYEFVNPCSSFAFDLAEDVLTDTIVIGFDNSYDFQLNEIIVLGY